MASKNGAVRILALHSFRTNAAIFQKQLRLSGWDRLLTEELGAAFTFIDAPHTASGPIPDDVLLAFGKDYDGDLGAYREWWNATQDEATRKWHYARCDESMDYLMHVWEEKGPFDVILGFSQGAAMTSLFSGLLKERGKVMPRCIVCISGIKVRDSRYDGLYQGISGLPALHIFGQKDPVKVRPMTLVLSLLLENLSQLC